MRADAPEHRFAVRIVEAVAREPGEEEEAAPGARLLPERAEARCQARQREVGAGDVGGGEARARRPRSAAASSSTSAVPRWCDQASMPARSAPRQAARASVMAATSFGMVSGPPKARELLRLARGVQSSSAERIALLIRLTEERVEADLAPRAHGPAAASSAVSRANVYVARRAPSAPAKHPPRSLEGRKPCDRRGPPAAGAGGVPPPRLAAIAPRRRTCRRTCSSALLVLVRSSLANPPAEGASRTGTAASRLDARRAGDGQLVVFRQPLWEAEQRPVGACCEDEQAVLPRDPGQAGAQSAEHLARFPEIGGGRRGCLHLRLQQLPLRPGQARVGCGVEGLQPAPARGAARRGVGQEVFLLDPETEGRVSLLRSFRWWTRTGGSTRAELRSNRGVQAKVDHRLDGSGIADVTLHNEGRMRHGPVLEADQDAGRPVRPHAAGHLLRREADREGAAEDDRARRPTRSSSRASRRTSARRRTRSSAWSRCSRCTASR